jgi:hypothetical protein
MPEMEVFEKSPAILSEDREALQVYDLTTGPVCSSIQVASIAGGRRAAMSQASQLQSNLHSPGFLHTFSRPERPNRSAESVDPGARVESSGAAMGEPATGRMGQDDASGPPRTPPGATYIC